MCSPAHLWQLVRFEARKDGPKTTLADFCYIRKKGGPNHRNEKLLTQMGKQKTDTALDKRRSGDRPSGEQYVRRLC